MGTTTSYQPIRAGEIYTCVDFINRLGITDETYERMVHDGLPVYTIYGLRFISGDEFINFARKHQRTYRS